MSDKKRSFRVIYEDHKYLFKGTSPSSVSKKVITKLCNLYKKKEVKFELNETTKDSKKKKSNKSKKKKSIRKKKK